MPDDDVTSHEDDDTQQQQEAELARIREETNKSGATKEELEALKRQLDSIHSDRSADAEERAELKVRIEKQDERINKLLEALEKKDEQHSNSTTIVVPPPDLDPPTHQNPRPEDIKPENDNEPPRKRKMRWY